MRLAVLGATGTIGGRIVREAADRGHEVTAVVRDPGRRVPGALQARQADPTDPASLAPALAGQDAVVSALGGAREGNADLVVHAAHALLEALPRAEVDRLVVVGGAGSLRWPHLPDVDGVDAPGFPDAWRPASLAQRDALGVYRAATTPVRWTYVSPADVIAPGERTGRYALGHDQFVVDEEGVSRISTEDYAVAVVDALEQDSFPQGRFTVGYGTGEAR